MNKPLSVRTKVEAVIAILVIGSIIVASVAFSSTVKFGTDPSTGQHWGIGGKNVITNSNGNTWLPTSANIQVAIDDLDSIDGTVYLPVGYFTLSSTLILYNVTLQGIDSVAYNTNDVTSYTNKGTIINLTGSANITLCWNSHLKDLAVIATTGHSGNAVVIQGPMWGYRDVLKNVQIFKATVTNGTGLSMIMNATATEDNYVAFCSFNDVSIAGFYYGMYLYAADDAGGKDGFINGNSFTSFFIQASIYPLYLYSYRVSSGIRGSVGGNSFSNIQIQSGASTLDGITLRQSCAYNTFSGVMFWDWTHVLGDTINLTDYANFNSFTGWFNYTYTNDGDWNTVSNGWYDSHWIENSRGKLFYPDLSGLQSAIYELNATGGGWVLLPNNHGLTLTSVNNPYDIQLINLSRYNWSIIRTENLTAADLVVGFSWYDTTNNVLYVYNGTKWVGDVLQERVVYTNGGTATGVYNGSWIDHGLPGDPDGRGSITLSLRGSSTLDDTHILRVPTVISSTATQFQIEFTMWETVGWTQEPVLVGDAQSVYWDATYVMD